MKKILRLLAWSLSVVTPVWAAGNGKAVAVVSSNSPFYLEALEGFKESFGGPVEVVSLDDGAPGRLPPAAVFAAFGTKAARLRFPDDAALVVCMAPGWTAPKAERTGTLSHVAMTPSPEATLATIKRHKAGWSVLAVPWMSESVGDFVKALRAEAGDGRVRVLDAHLRTPRDLPDALRRFRSQGIDALWLPPDPQLVVKDELRLIRDFAAANGIAFFVPAGGLLKEGATGAIAVSPVDVGRAAGSTARKAAGGVRPPPLVYADRAAGP